MHLLGVVLQSGILGAVIVIGLMVANGWGMGGTTDDEVRGPKGGRR